MKGYVYAEGEEELKSVRHLRQVFEFFKERSDPKKKKDTLIFSIGEGECQLVFTCQATVGRHYYFAVTFEHIEYLNSERCLFWVVHRKTWDETKKVSTKAYDKELMDSLPGFIHWEDDSWRYIGEDWEEGMALLKSYGFTWCEELEMELCDEKK